MKAIIGIAVGFSMVMAGLAAVSVAKTYSRSLNATELPRLAATGSGEVVAVPDIAEFTFDVIVEGGTDLAVLQSENTEKMNAVIAYLKQQGIADEDIRTAAYQIEPRQNYGKCEDGICPPPEIVGYTVTQSATVKVREISQAGDLLTGVVERGANSVSALAFTIDDLEAVRDQARTAAIEMAQTRAKAMAQAANVKLGRVLSMTETPISLPFERDFALAEAAFGEGGPSIEPGSEEVSVEVTIEYEVR